MPETLFEIAKREADANGYQVAVRPTEFPNYSRQVKDMDPNFGLAASARELLQNKEH